MSFFSLAEFYDRVNGEAYAPYAEYLESVFDSADIEVREVLDLGCGTGGITALLADSGYDMIGLDISPEMLGVARERNVGKNTLLLCQDMCDFELYGTVQAVYSSFDCLNYITEPDDLRRVFSLVRNYLEPGGVFVFDVNTRYRFSEVLDGASFVYEFEDNSLAVWRSAFSEESDICIFDIDVFSEDSDGRYSRDIETQEERCYDRDEIIAMAEGFTPVSVTGGKGFDGCSENEKEYYVFKRD